MADQKMEIVPKDSRCTGSATNGGTVDQDLVKSLAHPTRVGILEALQGRAASPTELAAELRRGLDHVAYHVRVLSAVGGIEKAECGSDSAASLYTARPRSFIGHQDWRRVPLSVRGGVTDEAMRSFVAKIGAAIDADTVDRREDTTLNWMPVTVDEQGWRDVAKILDMARQELIRVAASSRKRLGGEAGIPIVTGLAAFETPSGSGRETKDEPHAS